MRNKAVEMKKNLSRSLEDLQSRFYNSGHKINVA